MKSRNKDLQFDKNTVNLTKYFNSKEEALKSLKDTEITLCNGWWTIPKEVAEIVTPMSALLYSMLLGYSNGLYRGSNMQLAETLGCSTRTLSRLLDELELKRCIKIVIINKSTRLIYPLYTLPFIMDLDNKKYKDKVLLNEPSKATPKCALDFNKQLKEASQRRQRG